MIELSDIVVAKAREVGADDWLVALDELVAHVATTWGLTLGPSLPGGTEAFVCEVERTDRSPAVLKMMIPRRAEDTLGRRAAELETTVLQLAAGAGCAELFAIDEANGALLMEKLGPSLNDLDLPLAQQHDVMVGCAMALWRPAQGLGLPTGADKARWLIEAVTTQWERQGRPCSQRVIDHAIACAGRRRDAHDDERSVLVHGDIHQWNTLQTLGGDAYKLIDPDGLCAEPEYDLGILMREDPVELMSDDPFRRATHLSEASGLDAMAIWEWGVIERVSTGLLCVSIGLEPVGSQMLEAAEVLAAL